MMLIFVTTWATFSLMVAPLWYLHYGHPWYRNDFFCYEAFIGWMYPVELGFILWIGYPPLFFMPARRVYFAIQKCRKRSTSSQNSFVTRAFSKYLKPWLTFNSLALTWIDLAILIYMRRSEKKSAGPTFAGNQWGYGQVLAVLMWLLVLVE